MTQLERQEFYTFIMNLPQIQSNLENINHILLCGTRAIDIYDESSDYDIHISLKDLQKRVLIDLNGVVYQNKRVDFFINDNSSNFWPYVNKFIYNYNNNNLIYKDENYTIEFNSIDIKYVYEYLKKTFIFDNSDKIVQYKNSTYLTWLFAYYYYNLDDKSKKDFISNYKNISKPFMKSDILNDSETLSILNAIKFYIDML